MSWFDMVIKISSALLTPVLAILGAVILVKQYQLQRLRWRLDLYDKRYPVFLSTMEYISYAVQHHNMTNDELSKFLRNSKDREFLFGEDVQRLLDELRKKGVELQTVESVLNAEQDQAKREQLIHRSRDIGDWFQAQFDVSKLLFAKYLEVHKA